jgi:hypothetical protein
MGMELHHGMSIACHGAVGPFLRNATMHIVVIVRMSLSGFSFIMIKYPWDSFLDGSINAFLIMFKLYKFFFLDGNIYAFLIMLRISRVSLPISHYVPLIDTSLATSREREKNERAVKKREVSTTIHGLLS